MHALLYYPTIFTVGLVSLDLVFFAVSYTTSSRLFSFLARSLASYFCLVLCASYGVIASIALRLVGEQRLAQWTVARAFKWTMRFTTGVTMRVIEGEEYLINTRPAVIIGNHQTELDVLFLGVIFPKYCSVTAKKSLKNVPFLGWFMSLSGTVFLDRARKEQALKAFEGAAEEMKVHKQCVFIFPEGTRSYAKEPVLLPFKKGAFHLAVQAGVPIVPVVCENYSKILNIKDLRFNSGEVRVKVLPPIQTKDLTSADVDRITRETRDQMLQTLEDMARDDESRSIKGPTGNGTAKTSGVEVKPGL